MKRLILKLPATLAVVLVVLWTENAWPYPAALFVKRVPVGKDPNRGEWTYAESVYPGSSGNLSCFLEGEKFVRQINYEITKRIELAQSLRKQLEPAYFVTGYGCADLEGIRNIERGGEPSAVFDLFSAPIGSYLMLKRTPVGQNENQGKWGRVPTLWYEYDSDLCLKDGERLQQEINKAVAEEARVARDLGKKLPAHYISDVRCLNYGKPKGGKVP